MEPGNDAPAGPGDSTPVPTTMEDQLASTKADLTERRTGQEHPDALPGPQRASSSFSSDEYNSHNADDFGHEPGNRLPSPEAFGEETPEGTPLFQPATSPQPFDEQEDSTLPEVATTSAAVAAQEPLQEASPLVVQGAQSAHVSRVVFRGSSEIPLRAHSQSEVRDLQRPITASEGLTSSGSAGTRPSRAASVRRIWREWREIANDPSPLWTASPVDPAEPYEWHFTVRGPRDTAFEGGLYHGRLVLPVNYPMAPPSLYFLTISGRFEVQKQVCLSVTNFHPELWQPAWGIRSILEALHAFFPTPAAGAANSLDWSDATRRRLAQASVKYTCSICGRPNSELIKIQLPPGETHQSLLAEPLCSPLSNPSHADDRPKAPEEIEREEFERRQPPEPTSARTDGNSRLLGVNPDRWGLALVVLLVWLVRFLAIAGADMARRRFQQGGYLRLASLGGTAATDRWTWLVVAVAFTVLICLATYSAARLVGLTARVLSETFFLLDLPIQRVDQQTTAGEAVHLTNAERFESFEIHPWLLRLFGLV